VPTTTMLVVGRQPDDRVRRLAGLPGIECHFDVPTILPYLCAARTVVVPLRIGSGTRLKALEAMAARRPIVGTSIGLEGLGLSQAESAEISDDPEALAKATIRVLTDDAYADALARTARRIAEDRFSWDRVAQTYMEGVLGPSQ